MQFRANMNKNHDSRVTRSFLHAAKLGRCRAEQAGRVGVEKNHGGGLGGGGDGDGGGSDGGGRGGDSDMVVEMVAMVVVSDRLRRPQSLAAAST